MKLDAKIASISACLTIAVFGMTAVQAASPIKALEARVAELEATSVAVQAEIDSINTAITQLQTDLNNETATREGQVAELDGRVTGNESAISTNSAAIADHESRISTNESDIVANSALIEDNTNRIDALSSAGSTIGVYFSGTRIGTYVTTIDDASSGVPNYILLMNDNEYLFGMCVNSGTNQCGDKVAGDLMPSAQRPSGFLSGVVYTTADCSGQGYLYGPALHSIEGLGSLVTGSGYVFDFGGTIYYLPINTTPIRETSSTLRALSVSSDNIGCSPFTGTNNREFLYPVSPNDPAVTGVSTSSFALPLSLGFE